jgi:hypothetical protein
MAGESRGDDSDEEEWGEVDLNMGRTEPDLPLPINQTHRKKRMKRGADARAVSEAAHAIILGQMAADKERYVYSIMFVFELSRCCLGGRRAEQCHVARKTPRCVRLGLVIFGLFFFLLLAWFLPWSRCRLGLQTETRGQVQSPCEESRQAAGGGRCRSGGHRILPGPQSAARWGRLGQRHTPAACQFSRPNGAASGACRYYWQCAGSLSRSVTSQKLLFTSVVRLPAAAARLGGLAR